MDWLLRLPPELQRSAYLYGNEAAWPKEDAFAVIQALDALGKTVLGVEVWLRTDGAPRIPSPYVYAWDSGERMVADSKEASANLNAAAMDYVRGFEWDPRDIEARKEEPYFNLTV